MNVFWSLFAVLGITGLFAGMFYHLRDCYDGKVELNPLTWFAWTAAIFFQSALVFENSVIWPLKVIVVLILIVFAVVFVFSLILSLVGGPFVQKKPRWLQRGLGICTVILIAVFLFLVLKRKFQVPGLVDFFSLVALIIGIVPLCQEIQEEVSAEKTVSGMPWCIWTAASFCFALWISLGLESSWFQIVCAWGYVAAFSAPLLLIVKIAISGLGESLTEPQHGHGQPE